MHQNGAQVSDAVVLREFIENLVCDRVASGDEVTQHLNPPGAIEDLLSPFRRVVLQQIRRDTLQSGRDLVVGASQQFSYTSFRGARQTACAADEQVDLSAAVADPVAAVARARATDRAAVVADTDQRPDLLAAGARRRIAPQLPIAGSTDSPERQRGLNRDCALRTGRTFGGG